MRNIIASFFLMVVSLWAVPAEPTDIDTLLAKLQPEPQENLCKESVKTDREYLQCLEKKTKADPSIENVNFLAGVYAVKKQYDKAIKTYEINVAKGDKKATYYLAGVYNEALKQHDRAKTYFEKIKAYKDSTCQIGGILAIVGNESWFDSRNEAIAKKRTLAFYDSEIKNGNVKAYGCKGLYYNKFEEYDEAEKSFLDGVEHGDTQSLFYLGNLYSVYKYDIPKAIEYYGRAYETGNIQAAYNLGNTYNRSREHDKAIEWYAKAAEGGDLNGLLAIGNLLADTRQNEKAVKVFTKLGDLGDVRGYVSVGMVYKENKEYDKAEQAFKACVNKGYGDCAAGLGVMYEKDLHDNNQAEQWYQKGYELGYAGAANNLGVLYKNHFQDNAKALKWYQKASDLGDGAGAYNMGILYETEFQDKSNAIIWYRKAYEMGEKAGEERLKKLGAL